MANTTGIDFVVCESPDGWSLHAPGSSGEDIADGSEPYLASGTGEPTASDYQLAATLPRNPERTKALDRLLEAKDAAVRSRLAKP